jgi:hypothetical protein
MKLVKTHQTATYFRQKLKICIFFKDMQHHYLRNFIEMDSGEENAYKVLKMCLFPPLWFMNTIIVHIYDMGWPNGILYVYCFF